jgi:hypothetical protein
MVFQDATSETPSELQGDELNARIEECTVSNFSCSDARVALTLVGWIITDAEWGRVKTRLLKFFTILRGCRTCGSATFAKASPSTENTIARNDQQDVSLQGSAFNYGRGY